MNAVAALDETAVPRFGTGVFLQFDKVRHNWGLLAPERLFALDDQAAEILKLVDGTRSFGGIVDDLAARYQAPRELIAGDVATMLRELADKGAIHL